MPAVSDVYKRQEYGRIGGNLNQIARTLNEWHSPYPQLAGEVRAAVSDLAALKFAVFPETNCQGLFNQIHKKSTKKVPESLYGS